MRRIIWLILIAVILLPAVVIWVFIATQPGLRMIAPYLLKPFHGSLSVERVEGRLVGPLELHGIRYADSGTTVRIKDLTIDWMPSLLLSGELRINTIEANGAEIKSVPTEKKPTEQSVKLPFPFRVAIQNALIRDISVERPGRENLKLERISAGLYWRGDTVRIMRFEAVSDLFSIGAKGFAKLEHGYPFDLHTKWFVQTEEFSRVSGEGNLSGTLDQIRFTQTINRPFAAGISVVIDKPLSDLHWKADLSIQELATGTIRADWPEAKVSGTLKGEGSRDEYHAAIQAGISGKKFPAVEISAEGNGNLKGLAVDKFTAGAAGNRIGGSGAVNWEMVPGWKFHISGKGIDPGRILKGWPGDLALDADLTGTVSGEKPQAEITGRVKGSLRGYPFDSVMRGGLNGDRYTISRLDVHSGSAFFSASGTLGKELEIGWKTSVPDLAILPQFKSGSLSGHGKISGPRAAPAVAADLTGKDITGDSFGIGGIRLALRTDRRDLSPSMLDVKASDLEFGNTKWKRLLIGGRGKISGHTITVQLEGEKESAELLLQGGYSENAWKGELKKADFETINYGKWRLQKTGPLLVSRNAAESELCWVRGNSRICVKSEWHGNSGKGTITSSNLPLEILQPLLERGKGVKLKGSADLDAGWEYVNNSLSARVRADSTAGSITYSIPESGPVSLAFDSISIDSELARGALNTKLDIPLEDGGFIRGRFVLAGFNSLHMSPSQKIDGSLEVELKNLGLVPVIFPEIANAKGSLRAHLGVSGTVARPLVKGNASIEQAIAEIPAVGISLRIIRIRAESNGSGVIKVDGQIDSGPGTLVVRGNVDLRTKDRIAELHLKGESFKVSGTAGAMMLISPDITVSMKNEDVRIQGEIRIPKAEINPAANQKAVPVSGDIVIAGEQPEGERSKWKISGLVRIIFGEKVHFDGFGLHSRLSGTILLSQRPGEPPTATGEVDILEGVYKAYGQKLTISEGKLIFAGGPADNPGLNIQAVRKVGDVTAGINVQGTLRNPHASLFSTPVMEQTDILSYLILGRPLHSASGTEGRTLYNAALSLSLTGGEFLAKRIGGIFGIQDITVEKGSSIEEATVVLGRYLSPDLYVSYGIGLFQPTSEFRLRYQISRRLLLQTETGTQSGADLIYTYEH